MNREEWLVALVVSVPPAVGVVSAIRLSVPSMGLTAAVAGLVTFGAIFGVVYLAVEHEPDVPEDAAVDSDWPGIRDESGGDEDAADGADADAGGTDAEESDGVDASAADGD